MSAFFLPFRTAKPEMNLLKLLLDTPLRGKHFLNIFIGKMEYKYDYTN